MKVLYTLLTASALFSTFAFAESATSAAVQATHQIMEQDRNQNRFRTMSTNELLQMRGSMTQERDREQLHNELQKRYKTMSQEEKRKFDQHPPENRVKKGMGPGGMGGGKGGR